MRLFRILLPLLLFVGAQSAHADWSYDGTGDSHQINNLNKGKVNGWTVCSWVRNSSWDDDETIFSYGNGVDSSAGRGFSISTLTTGAIRVDYWDGGTANNAFPSTTMSDNTDHHLCWVRVSTGDNFLYLDATDATADNDEAIDPPAVQNSTDDFYIARDVPAATGFGRAHAAFTAAHTTYWDVALSAAEVASLANKSTCPTAVQASNLQMFIEGDVDPAVDESANAFTVTTNGGPTKVTTFSGLPCGGGGGTVFKQRSISGGVDGKLNGGMK